MNDVSSVRSNPQMREVPRQVQRQEPAERPERRERIERTERSVEKHATTVTRSTTETTHSVDARGRQEAVRDAEHNLLYMRNAARIHDDPNSVMQTLTYTQQASQVSTATVQAPPTVDLQV